MTGSGREDRKYSRVYHEAVDDPKFRDVWGNDACLALWVRLLVMAEQAWPASAALSRSTKERALATLVRVGLVLLHPDGDHYRISGLDKERTERSGKASKAALARWDADEAYAASIGKGDAPSIANGHAAGIAQPMPRRVRVQEETSQGVDGGTARDPEKPRLVRVEDGR